MSNEDKNKSTEEQQTDENNRNGKNSYVFMYIAMGCFAVGCILLGLSFVIKGVGVHLLIASMVSELTSVTFLNAQKRRVETKACKVIRILSYVVMAVALIIFVVGAGFGQTNK